MATYDPILHIVLYEPEIPHNAGAVGRTCVAVGAKLWLVRPLGFRVDDRQLRRAGLDYWRHLEWEVVDDWATLVRRLSHPHVDRGPGEKEVEDTDTTCAESAEQGFKAWLFSKTARIPYTQVRFQRGDVLVFGSETQGLPPSLIEANADRCLRIPIRREARSLNLSVSVGIIALEARRQMEGELMMIDD